MKRFPCIFAMCLTGFTILQEAVAQRTAPDRAFNHPAPGQNRNIQGTIHFTNELLQQMQQGWQQPLAQFGGGTIRVELWQVTYRPDPKNSQLTDILLGQRVSTVLTFEPVNNALVYHMDNIPALPYLAVIVYCNSLQTVPGLAVLGSPNDGHGGMGVRRYASDAGKHISNGRGSSIREKKPSYGIFSLVEGQTNLQEVDFTLQRLGSRPGCATCFDLGDLDPSKIVQDIDDAVTAVVNGISYVFDQTVDGIGSLANFAIQTAEQGVVQLSGYFINQTGQIFYEIGGGLVNLIVFGNLPRMRKIQAWEYDWANGAMFNGDLPPKSSIWILNFMNPDHHRFYTTPSLDGNEVYMNLGDAFDNPVSYVDNINHAYLAPGQVFIHEMTHAWQIHAYGASAMLAKYVKDGGSGQTYNHDCSYNINSNFNLEQEASMNDALYARLYFPGNLFPAIPAGTNCGFEQNWVQLHIRSGVPFDTATLYATIAMKLYASGLTAFVGDCSRGVAIFSTGNAADRGGYFMPGSQLQSMLYFWSAARKTSANWGEVRKKYLAAGAEKGALGWPADNMVLGLRQNGSFQRFAHGWIYSTPQWGTFIISGAIFDAWARQHWENGALGFPISDYIPDNNGPGGSVSPTVKTASGLQKFEHGIIKYTNQLDQVQTQVVMNDQLIGSNNRNLVSPGTNTNPVNRPGATPGTGTKPSPGEKGSLNPQPLPPKQPLKSAQ